MDAHVQPDRRARPEYVEAFGKLVARIADSLTATPRQVLPIRMFIAGGAALHFYTGERVSRDIDAAFSHRIALPENLEVAWRDTDGTARLLYFDRQYSGSLALLHEDAYDESRPLSLPGVDASVLDVRLLSPLDLAITKLARFSSQDRDDIASLARRGLISAKTLRKRANAALVAYVGDTGRVRTSIELGARLIEGAGRHRGAR